MDLVKKYDLHLAEGFLTLTREELAQKVRDALVDCPSEYMTGYSVWYENFEGCGRPPEDVYNVIIDTMRNMPGEWEDIGTFHWEFYGNVNPSFKNLKFATAQKVFPHEFGDVQMLLHQFHAGKHYQGPDGRVFWIPVIEDFDMRCFERKDGKYVGSMVEIDPNSEYARQMVQID